MKIPALLVAMSVGASIVIARPEDIEPLKTNIADHIPKTEKTTSPVLHKLRDLALKTYGLGKKLSHKTANASVYISDRIGDRVSSLLKWFFFFIQTYFEIFLLSEFWRRVEAVQVCSDSRYFGYLFTILKFQYIFFILLVFAQLL